MAFLTPDRIRKESINGVPLEIKEKIIPDNMKATKDVASWCKKGQPMKPCLKLGAKTGVPGTGKALGVTIHNTNDISEAKGTNDAEQYARATYNGNMLGVVVHFYVWHGEIWQLLRLDEQGWHAGDGKSQKTVKRSGKVVGGNLDTVAIECISADDASTETTAKLTALLCKQLNLNPRTDIYQHWDFSGKRCPAYLIPIWDFFMDMVQRYYDGTKVEPFQAGVQVGAAVRFKSNARTYYPGGPTLPAWVKTGDPHRITQTLYGGNPVVRGTARCVLLGKRVNLATGKESAGVNTWAAMDYLDAA